MAKQKSVARIVRSVMRNLDKSLRGIRCKFCSSPHVTRFGHGRKGTQQYWCVQCKRKFQDPDTLPHAHSPMSQQSGALSMFYGGMPFKEIRRHLAQEHNNVGISRSTLDRWVSRYSKIAIDEAKKQTPKVGDTWIADETVLRIATGKGGRNIWFFDLIDSDTRFLLASHMTFTRTTRAAQTLMEKAYERAGKAPKKIITDGLNVYVDAIELVFGSDSKHVQSRPFVEKDSTNQIERFHGTLKSRTAIMRGLKKPETARKLLDGWLVQYNYFRPHDALEDKTPAEAAGIGFAYKSWADVIKSRSYPNRPTDPDMRFSTITHDESAQSQPIAGLRRGFVSRTRKRRTGATPALVRTGLRK